MKTIGEIPASGEIYLKSSVVDWDPYIWGYSGEFRMKAFIKIKVSEKVKEIDILIYEIFQTQPIEIFIDVVSKNKDIWKGLEGCFEPLKIFVSKDMKMFKAYLLLGDGKRISVFLVHFPAIKKFFYTLMRSDTSKNTFPNYLGN